MKALALFSTALLAAALTQAAAPTPTSAPAVAPTAAPATAPATAPLGLAEVHQRVLAAGYRDVRELQRKRSGFEAEATDRDGRRVELTLDLATGAVRQVEVQRGSAPAPAAGLDLGQLLARVEAAGYRAVHKIEREGDQVEVRAEDAQGQRVKLRLDPTTGAVRPSGR